MSKIAWSTIGMLFFVSMFFFGVASASAAEDQGFEYHYNNAMKAIEQADASGNPELMAQARDYLKHVMEVRDRIAREGARPMPPDLVALMERLMQALAQQALLLAEAAELVASGKDASLLLEQAQANAPILDHLYSIAMSDTPERLMDSAGDLQQVAFVGLGGEKVAGAGAGGGTGTGGGTLVGGGGTGTGMNISFPSTGDSGVSSGGTASGG